ncbi:trypsin-like serine peptidase [Staphylococcus intermedius]|uniref:Serine protease n=1 Tax=Staphylococcus intermedius NCTC 11048 TaxID=1141106 RepID=A0A380G680_STAIN|nr:serine protease [Staphylococcus intermedius]PCF64202.1 serine protease [Staphylococcus intermedius]PCF78917.1 serine protease [Staphylococcus intermedius]PCF79889.1 serine protease [Staphylococcus intermedius]PCF89451.1 serine protease [Staphylococcus intermedius]PNZ50906.1 serine protease [Staphylococcus intermedius NCTC 11048]
MKVKLRVILLSAVLMFVVWLSGKSTVFAEVNVVASDGIIENQYYPEGIELNPETLPITATEKPSSGPLEIDQSKVKPIEYLYQNGIERVFGEDQRQPVTHHLKSPYKQVVLLNMTFPNGKTYSGSGTMISEDTVLTAAHNIYAHNVGWAKEVTVYAGKKGNQYTIGKAKSKKIWTFKQWIDSTDQNYDIGVIKLDSKLGKKTGTLGITSRIKEGEKIEISGFPGDKPGEMQYKSTGHLKKVTDNILYYDVDTYNGQSGSGVRNSKNQLIGVHTFGGEEYNGGVRLNALKIDYIKHWMGTPVAHPYHKFVKLNHPQIPIWTNLELTLGEGSGSVKMGEVYFAKYAYNHPDGQKYYSLYKTNGEWIGYTNGHSIAPIKKATAQKFNQQIKVNKGKITVWKGLQLKQKVSTKHIKAGHQYNAKEIYYHPNGKQYYALYDKKGKRIGYIDSRIVTVVK